MRKPRKALRNAKRWVKLAIGKWALRGPPVSHRLREDMTVEHRKIANAHVQYDAEGRALSRSLIHAERAWQEVVPPDMILQVLRGDDYAPHTKVRLTPEYFELPESHPAKVAEEQMVHAKSEIGRAQARWEKEDGRAYLELRMKIAPSLVRRTLAWMNIRDRHVRNEIIEAINFVLSYEMHHFLHEEKMGWSVPDRAEERMRRVLGPDYERFMHIFGKTYIKAFYSTKGAHA